MKVLDAGHRYEVANFDNPETFQEISFVSKSPVEEGSKEMKLNFDGTTNEELLAVLIDRTKYLNGLFPCRENSIAITKMEEAKMWFEERTRNRLARNVEGKHVA
jgi:hypothetical protein